MAFITNRAAGGAMSARAKYGSGLLTNLSHLLSMKLGRGYSYPNLNNMRKFYLTYPICQNVSDKLNWSQICELITVSDPLTAWT